MVIGLMVVLVQWLVLGRLPLWGAYPDAMLLYAAWVGMRYGRRAGAIGGFLLGFCFDAIYGTWGVHMFVKTLVGFLMGIVPASERETLLVLPRQALVGGFVIALLHNGLVVTMMALQAGAANTYMATVLWFGSALYTAFIGTLAALVSIR